MINKQSPATNQVKFHLHYVTNGQVKARVFYSLDNHVSKRPCVTLFAKDFDRSLGRVFTEGYQNDSDLMTDYFDKGRIRFFEGHALYKEARAAAERKHAKDEAKYAPRRAAHEAYMQARIHPETVKA